MYLGAANASVLFESMSIKYDSQRCERLQRTTNIMIYGGLFGLHSIRVLLYTRTIVFFCSFCCIHFSCLLLLFKVICTFDEFFFPSVWHYNINLTDFKWKKKSYTLKSQFRQYSENHFEMVLEDIHTQKNGFVVVLS